jgi:hypothetical protein
MAERRALSSKLGNSARPTLEQQIAAALRADASLSSADLETLIGEVEVAAAAAAQTAVQERERALDPLSSIDSAAAHAAVVAAELRRDRFNAALPRLRQQLDAAQQREATERWEARYQCLQPKLADAAAKFARYPDLAAQLSELMTLAVQVDEEVSALNGSAPPDERRRLKGVELTARALDSFSVSQPSIAQGLRLPVWQHSEQMAWPPPQRLDPSLFVPVQVGDPRLTTDRWWEVGEEQRASEQERQRRELEEAEVARKQFYGQA